MYFKILYEAGKNKNLQIVSAPDIVLLGNLGIRAGTRVTVQNRYAFGGPVLLRVENAYTVAVGKDIAEEILVCGA